MEKATELRNELEVKVYEGFLQHGPETVAVLSELIDVPRDRVSPCVTRLARRGLLTVVDVIRGISRPTSVYKAS